MTKRLDQSFLKRFLIALLCLIGVPPLAFGGWLLAYGYTDIGIESVPLQFGLKHGSSLRSATRQMQAAGALHSPLQFELLARLNGEESRIQAGSYELSERVTPIELLRKITSADRTQERIVFVEGWTFRQMRAALDAHTALSHDTRDLDDATISIQLGLRYASPEGLFFPDTYYFTPGSRDLDVLRRAHTAMQSQLDALWAARAAGLPLENPYQALILASIVEKETGRPSERAMIAAVFINRLKMGMRLQTDPTVIYGMGTAFDGNLRKQDLLTDGPYNTYTRPGLPPTPIAMPGLGSFSATLAPETSDMIYFVSRGDGTSEFSRTLADHERAVTKYQRRSKH